MRTMWEAPSRMPDIEQILSHFSLFLVFFNFSFPFSPVFINSMFCVKDEKELEEGQIQVLNGIVSPNLKYVPFRQMITDQGQIQFLAF